MKVIDNGKLNIAKRSIFEWLTLCLFLMPFFFPTLQEFLGIPSIIRYTLDIVWVSITVFLLFRNKIELDKRLIPFFILICCFIIYTVIIYLFNFQSPIYYLWGFRNNFRFYFAFIAFSMFCCEEDAEKCLKFMDILFWINADVSVFQFFVLGYQQDFLGGIFGVERGCNGYSILFFSIVISKSVLRFMRKEEHLFNCGAKCAVALIISSMAEIKYFFILFMIIILLSAGMTSFSWRKMVLIFVFALIIAFAGSLLTLFHGENSNVSIERILELAFTSNYSSGKDLSRLFAIPTISNDIMTNNMQRLFGFGLGNCDASSFQICNTPFFEKYSYLHYNWFSNAFMFLETGIVGFLIYLSFFVMCFVYAFKRQKENGTNSFYCQMASIISVICIFVVFYNASLRTEAGYMAYFVLALPIISEKSEMHLKIS